MSYHGSMDSHVHPHMCVYLSPLNAMLRCENLGMTGPWAPERLG